jgi:hypothetical protein
MPQLPVILESQTPSRPLRVISSNYPHNLGMLEQKTHKEGRTLPTFLTIPSVGLASTSCLVEVGLGLILHYLAGVRLMSLDGPIFMLEVVASHLRRDLLTGIPIHS